MGIVEVVMIEVRIDNNGYSGGSDDSCGYSEVLKVVVTGKNGHSGIVMIVVGIRSNGHGGRNDDDCGHRLQLA